MQLSMPCTHILPPNVWAATHILSIDYLDPELWTLTPDNHRYRTCDPCRNKSIVKCRVL